MALSACSTALRGLEWLLRMATPAEAPDVTVRPRNTKPSASMACSSAAAFARASVSLRFHSSTANSSPPSRPTTSEARTSRSSAATIAFST